jgi:tetratricopeptide (TPR) repeat protein
LEKAEELYRSILINPEAKNDPSLIAAAAGHLGKLLGDTGRPDEALEFLDQAFSNYTMLENERDIAAVMIHQGNAWAQKGNVNKAIELHQASIIKLRQLLEETDNTRTQTKYWADLCAAYNDLAYDYLDRGQEGDTNKAIEHLNQAIEAASESKSDERKAYVYATLAEAYLAAGIIDSALDSWLRSSEIVETLDHQVLKGSLTEIMESINAATQTNHKKE